MLNEKVIIITGSAGLLGKDLVRTCLNHGATVVATDIHPDLSSIFNDISFNDYANQLVLKTLDITDALSINDVIETTHKEFGSIDAVISNAYPRNSEYGNKLEDVSYNGFVENLGLHVGGYFLVAQKFCEYFKSQGHGNVINMASIYGSMPPRFEIYADTEMTMPVEYAAIKSSIISLTKYFAQYYKQTGIRVNCLSPGGIFNDQDQVFVERYNSFCATKGMLNPEDVSKAAVFLLSDSSSYMTGQDLIIDDGFSL